MTQTRILRIAAAAILVASCSPLSSQASDWPKFLGPDGSGISKETGINKDWNTKPPKELWRLPMTDQGYSGPAVANGMVYVIDHKQDDEIIKAVDLVTGAEKWSFHYAEPGKDADGLTRSSPTVDNGEVYAISRFGTVVALDAATGEKKWMVNPVKAHNGEPPEWQCAGSPVIDGDKLIIIAGGENALVVALDKKTGKEIWAGGGTDKPGYATPVVATLADVKQYIIFTGKNLTGVKAADGTVLWTQPWKTQYDVNAATPMVTSDGRILVSSGYRSGMMLFKLEGNEIKGVWEQKNKKISLKWSSPVVLDGYIYCVTEPGYLACVDLANGQEKWRSKGGDEVGFEYGGLCAVDGTLIVISGNTGSVVQVKAQPASYEELGRINPLNASKCWTAPVVANKKLLVRSPAELVCLDLAP